MTDKVLMPRKPSEAMLQAGIDAMFSEDSDGKRKLFLKSMNRGYKAMLAASEQEDQPSAAQKEVKAGAITHSPASAEAPLPEEVVCALQGILSNEARIHAERIARLAIKCGNKRLAALEKAVRDEDFIDSTHQILRRATEIERGE